MRPSPLKVTQLPYCFGSEGTAGLRDRAAKPLPCPKGEDGRADRGP